MELTTYFQRELSQGLARLSGGRYEKYWHESGSWAGVDQITQSEIVYSGNWYILTEEEASALIADVQSGAFYEDSQEVPASDAGSEWSDPPAAVPMTGNEQFIDVTLSNVQ